MDFSAELPCVSHRSHIESHPQLKCLWRQGKRPGVHHLQQKLLTYIHFNKITSFLDQGTYSSQIFCVSEWFLELPQENRQTGQTKPLIGPIKKHTTFLLRGGIFLSVF